VFFPQPFCAVRDRAQYKHKETTPNGPWIRTSSGPQHQAIEGTVWEPSEVIGWLCSLMLICSKVFPEQLVCLGVLLTKVMIDIQ
jgi:hypothetical protein